MALIYVPQNQQATPNWSDTNLNPQYFWIDKGPFLDRLDTYGYAGLKNFVLGAARTNDTCYALQADLSIRAYTDLKGRRAEILAGLDGIAAVVAAAGRPAFTPEMRAAVLDSPSVDAERHIKGLVQPL